MCSLRDAGREGSTDLAFALSVEFYSQIFANITHDDTPGDDTVVLDDDDDPRMHA